MSESNISARNVAISLKILGISQLYFKNNWDIFKKNLYCIKPEKGAYLNFNEIEKLKLSDMSFTNNDGKKNIFACVSKTGVLLESVLLYFQHLKLNLTDDEWEKFSKRQSGFFKSKNIGTQFYNLEVEFLSNLSVDSFPQIKSVLRNLNWNNLSKIEQEKVFKAFIKIYEYPHLEAKGIIANYLLDNHIDDEKVNHLKYLKNSIFESSKSKIVTCDFVSIKTTDILSVASWDLDGTMSVSRLTDLFFNSLMGGFEHFGIEVSRQNKINQKYVNNELEILFKKNTVDAQKVTTEDIKNIIDAVLTKISNINNLNANAVKIIFNEYMMEKEIPSTIMNSNSLKF